MATPAQLIDQCRQALARLIPVSSLGPVLLKALDIWLGVYCGQVSRLSLGEPQRYAITNGNYIATAQTAGRSVLL